MYINYKSKGNVEYGMAVKSVRSGSTVTKSEIIYLGRVIDKERHIFKSRERGIFTFDVETGTFGCVDPDYIEPILERKNKRRKRPVLIVSFGDIFLLESFVEGSGFSKAVNAIGYKNSDTIRALLAYYILSPHANCHAHDWWSLTYAKFLYPNAQMYSQRISEALADIGSEEAKRGFFREYFKFLENSYPSKEAVPRDKNTIDDGILIDSTGLPNSVRFPLTAVSNHNGNISEEVRHIYVVQQNTGMPLFFRYVSGNIVDVSTLIRTIAELKANGVNTKFAILDAGYYTGKNADVLMDENISFITRMKSNFKIYKDAVSEHLASLECRENLVRHNKRLVYVKCIPCKIGEKGDRPAYAYLCKDLAMKHELERRLVEKAEDQGMGNGDMFDEMQRQGVFMLVSSRKISKDKLLPIYYMRDQVEKIFELCKQEGKILPLNVETEATFRGHLLMTFMAAALLKMMSKTVASTSLTTESMFMNLHEQHAVVYDDELITSEPTKKMNEAYSAFKLHCPISLSYKK